jgi:NADPH2:quinone reductase
VNVRAIRVREKGGPEVLRAETIDLAEPGPGEARVRHAAIGLNYIDVYFRTGWYAPPGYPFVPGMEGAGVVEALGPRPGAGIGAGIGASTASFADLAVGDRVGYATRPLGAYAEARNLAVDRLVKLPDGIDARLAAAILLKGMTARYLVRRVFRVERGSTVLVHAAAGGVGSILCQWAKHLGATVLGTVSTEEKAARARADGCDHPILYTQEDFVARVGEITRGTGVDVVYDSVGKDTFLRSLACLAPMGTLALYGQSSGSVAPLDVSLLAKKSLFLTRPGLPDYTAKREDLLASARELFDVVLGGAVRVHVDREYRLEDVQQAHRDLEGRKTTGSSVLVP